MKKTVKILIMVLVLALTISIPNMTAFADNENGDNQQVSAAWFCELVGGAEYPSSVDSAVYALVSALNVDGESTETYISENAPYVSLTLDGKPYGKAYFEYNEEKGFGAAATTLYGYGEFKGVVCANEDDSTIVAQNADATYDSVFTLNSYENGMRVKSTVLLDEASAAGLWQQITGMPDFKDVLPTDWFYNSVVIAYQNGLLTGKSKDYFEPKSNMTYIEAITLAARLNALLTNNTIDTVLEENEPWYQPFLDYSYENGIPCQYEDFDADINRKDFVKLVYNACTEEKLTPVREVPDNSIPDVAMGSDGAAEIYALYKAGILSGNDAQGSFYPYSTIKRCEVAAIISRLL